MPEKVDILIKRALLHSRSSGKTGCLRGVLDYSENIASLISLLYNFV
jgi:hypothetical protein